MTNLDRLIHDADPALGEEIPEASSPAARLAYLRAAHRGATGAPRAWRRPGLSVPMAAAAALAALLVLVGVGPSSRPPTASAAQLLRSMATLAAVQPALSPGPGQYVYLETASSYQATVYVPELDTDELVATTSAQYSETEQSWADAAGSGSGQLTRSPLAFPSAADEAAWSATSAAQNFSRSYRQSVAETSLSEFAPDVSSLPTDPSALATDLAAGTGATNPDLVPDGPSAVFLRAARLLVGPDIGMSPSLASALYEVMADQPGVDLVGSATDHQGRSGSAVTMSSSQGVSEVIVDTQDGAVLEASFVPPTLEIASPATGGSAQVCASDGTCMTEPESQGLVLETPLWTDNLGASIVSQIGATSGS